MSVAPHGAATTNADGEWQFEGTGFSASPLAATISAAGYVTRETLILWPPGGRQNADLDLLPDRSPFVLAFYRQLVRNAYDEPDNLQPLRRWTVNPNFHVNTLNPRTGEPILSAELDAIVRSLHESVPQLTGGRLSVGTVETTAGPRPPRPGYINIDIVYEPDADFCGRAGVGRNPGEITLNYDGCSSCGSQKLSPNVVAHEVGHALGFWHVPRGIMQRTIDSCSGTRFTDAERLHARIAYQRPPGNMDPDRDPDDYAALTIGSGPTIVCNGRRPDR